MFGGGNLELAKIVNQPQQEREPLRFYSICHKMPVAESTRDVVYPQDRHQRIDPCEGNCIHHMLKR